MPDPAPTLALTVSVSLAESYRYAGRPRQAAEAFEEVFGRLASLGRDDTEQAMTILNNWAGALAQLGQPREAERLFRRALQIDSPDGKLHNASPTVLANLAKSLLELHRLPEATRHLERAHAEGRRAGHERLIANSGITLASVYREQGEVGRAARLLADIGPRVARLYSSPHVIAAALAAEQGRLAEARGDHPAALAATDRAVAIARATPRGGGGYVARYLRRRSEVHLLLHHAEQARADATAALADHVAVCGPKTLSAEIGLDNLALGRALWAQGRIAEARAALSSAETHLTASLDEEHPAVRTARRSSAPGSPDPDGTGRPLHVTRCPLYHLHHRDHRRTARRHQRPRTAPATSARQSPHPKGPPPRNRPAPSRDRSLRRRWAEPGRELRRRRGRNRARGRVRATEPLHRLLRLTDRNHREQLSSSSAPPKKPRSSVGRSTERRGKRDDVPREDAGNATY